MRQQTAGRLLPAASAAAFAALLGTFWATRGASHPLRRRTPGDQTVTGETVAAPVAGLPGELIAGDGKVSDLPGLWPQFRGPGFDAVSTEAVPLLRGFGPEGPPRLWLVEVGEGHAGAAVRNGRVYLLDYDPQKRADALRCLSLADGGEVWRRSYSIRIKRQHGMSRTIPAVTDKYVVTLGPKCHVLCVDADSGQYRWSIDLIKEYGTELPPWYAGQCPIIDEGRAILAPAGPDVLMMAVDCETGRVVWTTPNPDRWDMTHVSILPVTFQGTRMYVYCGSGGVVGVAPEDGRVLWKTDLWRGRIATVPTPVWAGEGRLFFCSGYTAGAMMLRLVRAGDAFDVQVVFDLTKDGGHKVFGSEQQTPVFYQDHIYGVRSDGQLVCLDLEGRIVWASGPKHRFGVYGGPYLVADGMLLVMSDDGVLTLAEAGPAGYKQLAQAKVVPGHEAWGPMALTGGRLLARDLTNLVCLDMTRR